MEKRKILVGTMLIDPKGNEEAELFALSRIERGRKVTFSLSIHRKGRLPHVRSFEEMGLQRFLARLSPQQKLLKNLLGKATLDLQEGKGSSSLELQGILASIEKFQKGGV